MGRGTFMLTLSAMEKVSSLVTNSHIAMDGKIITLVPWYRGFRASHFDAQFHVPHFPMTLLFPGLATKLRPYVSDFGGHFGRVM